MANTKSAKKQARKNDKRRLKNLARKTAIKTAIKKVNASIEQGLDSEKIQTLMQDVAAKLSRAKGKGVIHANTASRKLSRLTKKLNKAEKAESK